MKPIMEFEREADLQEFMHRCLGGTREVKLSAVCRIDLRTDEYDIEIKPYLTKPAIDKAAGQLFRYAQFSEGRQLVIAGCTPSSYDQSTELLAAEMKSAGVEVWFVDQMDIFQNAYLKLYGSDRPHTPFNADADYGYDVANFHEETPDHDGNPLVFLFWAMIAIFALFIANGQPSPTAPQQGAIAPQTQTQPALKGEATIVKTVNIRRSPEINESNLIGKVNPGDVVTLTGRTEANADAVWVEIENDKGDRAWIARSGVGE